jgi:membrane protein required for colicin V production
VVCLAYLIFQWAEPNRAEWPAWITEAKSGPLLAKGAALLAKALPKDALERGAAAASEAGKKAATAIESGKGLDSLTPEFKTPTKDPAAPSPDSGYKQDDRKDMNRLLQNNQ